MDASVRSMTENLSLLIKTFHESNNEGLSVIQKTESVCAELHAELDSLASILRGYRNVAQTIQQAEEALTALATKARVDCPQLVLDEVEKNLEEMKERYTMHNEHDTHTAYMKKQNGEMNDASSSETAKPLEGSVELF
jgi:hypothetical protein